MISIEKYLLLVLCVSLWEAGWWKITRKGMIFDFVRKFFEKTKEDKNNPNKLVDVFPEWISMPIVTCVTCYSSIHTLIFFLLFVYLHPVFSGVPFDWMLILLVSLPCAFINTLFVQIHLLIENYIHKNNPK